MRSILALGLCLFSLEAFAVEQFYVDSFGADRTGRSDSTDAIRAAIEAAKTSATGAEVIFSRLGRYRVSCTNDPHSALGQHFCFRVLDSQNVAIIGNSAFIRIDNPVFGFLQVRNSKDISVKGFKIFYGRRPYTQGTVTAVCAAIGPSCPSAPSIVLAIDDGFPELNLDIFNATYLAQTFGSFFDGSSNSLKHYAGNFARVTEVAQRLEYGKYLVKFASVTNMVNGQNVGIKSVSVGDGFAISNRSQRVFDFYKNSDITLASVTLYNGPGAATVWQQNTGKITINHFNLLRSKGTSQIKPALISTAADAIHMVDNRASLTITNSRIEGMLDDAFNTRSSKFDVMGVKDNTVDLKFTANLFRVGDLIQIATPTSSVRGAERIKAFSIFGNIARVTLEKAIAGVVVGDYAFDAELATPYAVLRNNVFGNFRGHFRMRAYGAIFEGNQILDARNAHFDTGLSISSSWQEGPSLMGKLPTMYSMNNYVGGNGVLEIRNPAPGHLNYWGQSPSFYAGRDLLLVHPLVFNPAEYRALYPDLSSLSDGNLILHWLNHGIDEGRRGNADFRSTEYRQLYTDLSAQPNRSLVSHFVRYGAISEFRFGSILSHPWVFQPEEYLAFNPDLTAMDRDALRLHWVKSGLSQGRRGASAFSTQMYFNRYPDLEYLNQRWADLIRHYVLNGKSEGRVGN